MHRTTINLQEFLKTLFQVGNLYYFCILLRLNLRKIYYRNEQLRSAKI